MIDVQPATHGMLVRYGFQLRFPILANLHGLLTPGLKFAAHRQCIKARHHAFYLIELALLTGGAAARGTGDRRIETYSAHVKGGRP